MDLANHMLTWMHPAEPLGASDRPVTCYGCSCLLEDL